MLIVERRKKKEGRGIKDLGCMCRFSTYKYYVKMKIFVAHRRNTRVQSALVPRNIPALLCSGHVYLGSSTVPVTNVMFLACLIVFVLGLNV